MAAKTIGFLVLTLTATSVAYASAMTSANYRVSSDSISASSATNSASPAYLVIGPASGRVTLTPPEGATSPGYSTRPLALSTSGAAYPSPTNGVLDPTNSSGEPSLADALIAMRAVMGDLTLSPSQIVHADVAPLKNGRPAPDGRVDLGDVLLILRRVVKLVSW